MKPEERHEATKALTRLEKLLSEIKKVVSNYHETVLKILLEDWD